MYAVIKIPAEAGSTLNVFAIAGRIERSATVGHNDKACQAQQQNQFLNLCFFLFHPMILPRFSYLQLKVTP